MYNYLLLLLQRNWKVNYQKWQQILAKDSRFHLKRPCRKQRHKKKKIIAQKGGRRTNVRTSVKHQGY